MQPADLVPRLANALTAHRVHGQLDAIVPGPRVTRYDLALSPGTKVSKLTKLQQELALALCVPSVRVVPVPERGVVGIEVPNAQVDPVNLVDLLDDPEWKDTPRYLPLVIGKRADGSPICADLATMPHLLLAGTTGSGKSVALNAMLCGLLMSRPPEDLHLVLIDPKVVELTPYRGLPHLREDVVTTAERAQVVLRGLEAEMDARYLLLERHGVRSLAELRAQGKQLPFIVVVIDELADLILHRGVGKEIEMSLVRLAQKARAAGIHLIAATQRPQARVLTGLIKANFPCRMAFRVPQSIDSRVILDQSGAEDLLGQGDMLFLSPETVQPQRVQGVYAPTAVVEAVIARTQERHPKSKPSVVARLCKVLF
jgi:S-DNA-T family DNA segregation ATPase FtsK/SpoIIIE